MLAGKALLWGRRNSTLPQMLTLIDKVLEDHLQRELSRARAANRVQGALAVWGPPPSMFVVDVPGQILPKVVTKPLTWGIWIALRTRGSEHWMVEHIEVFCAQIEIDPLGQVESPAQRQVGLIDGVRAAQPVSGKVSYLSFWERKRIGVQGSTAGLRRIRNPDGVSGHNIYLSRVAAERWRELPDEHIDGWRAQHSHQSVHRPFGLCNRKCRGEEDNQDEGRTLHLRFPWGSHTATRCIAA
jgi:hypothetical protein